MYSVTYIGHPYLNLSCPHDKVEDAWPLKVEAKSPQIVQSYSKAYLKNLATLMVDFTIPMETL